MQINETPIVARGAGTLRHAREVALWCGLVAILDGFSTQSIAYVVPALAELWKAPAPAFGPVFAMGLFGLTLGTMLLGPSADRIGRRRVIILSTLIFGVLGIATAWAGSLHELLVLRFLSGVGLGGAMPNLIALTSESAPEKSKARFVAIMFSGYPLGAVLGGVVSADLITRYGWQSVFYVGGVASLIVVIGLLARLSESPQFLAAAGNRLKAGGRPGNIASRVAGLFQGGLARTTALIWICYFANLLGWFTLINWLPTLLRQAGLPLTLSILSAAVLNLGGVLGAFGLSGATKWFRPLKLVTVAYVCAAVAILTVSRAYSHVPVLMGAACIVGIGISGSQLLLNAVIANLYPTSMRATAVSWALGVGRIGTIVGPLIGGVLLSLHWSYSTLVAWTAIPALIAAVTAFLLERVTRAAEQRVQSGSRSQAARK